MSTSRPTSRLDPTSVRLRAALLVAAVAFSIGLPEVASAACNGAQKTCEGGCIPLTATLCCNFGGRNCDKHCTNGKQCNTDGTCGVKESSR